MSQWYQYLVQQLRALFLTEVGLGFEAQFLTREAERKADLLRKANQYDEEGFPEIAETLRERAGQISIERPLASVCPAAQHLELQPAASAMLEPVTASLPQSDRALLDKPSTPAGDEEPGGKRGARKSSNGKSKPRSK